MDARPFLVAGMLITGCSNSLFSKWQDMQCVDQCDTDHPVYFEQPVWQTLNMFLGELGCFLPVIFSYYYSKPAPLLATSDGPARSPSIPKKAYLLFFFPAACDLTGTTLMNIGLLMTPVSIYQMTRGALVLWVGVFSVIFLRRKLYLYQWLALVTVMIGVCLVGLSGSLIKKALGGTPDAGLSADEDPSKVFAGVLFILFAQLFTAAQFVMEEKIMLKYTVMPLTAVGLEGFFGCIGVLLAMPFLYLFKDQSVWFDLPKGFWQIIDNPTVWSSSIIIAFSIAFFNFFGLSVTRSISATARSTIDTCRTLGIWIVSLLLGWEALRFPISLLQITGFALLVYGTFLFNDLVMPPKCIRADIGDEAPISAHEADDESTALLAGEERISAEARRHRSIERTLEETATLPSDLGTSGYDVVPPPTRN